MLDLLKELFIWFGSAAAPCWVVKQTQRGIRLRFGRYVGGVLEPGLHWKIPFVDQIQVCPVVVTTMDLSDQTITTSNGVQVVIESTLKYEVQKPAKLMVEVKDATDALADMSKGIIREVATSMEWPQLNGVEFVKEINSKIKKEAQVWGFKVHSVSIVTLAPMRSIRLLQTTSQKNTEFKAIWE